MKLMQMVLGQSNDAVMAALNRSQAVIHFTPDGTVLWANDNFCKALGYSLDEIKGKHHSLFVEPDYAASQDYKDFWNTLRSGRFQCAQYKRLAKGGRAVYIEASYNPVYDARGRTVKVVKLATDITVKTLKMKEALDRSQAVISFTLDGTILEANDNFLNAMGYTLAEVKGQHHRMFVEQTYAQSASYRDFWGLWAVGSFRQASSCVSARAARKSGYRQAITRYSAMMAYRIW